MSPVPLEKRDQGLNKLGLSPLSLSVFGFVFFVFGFFYLKGKDVNSFDCQISATNYKLLKRSTLKTKQNMSLD